jgi:uncharacterized small protein (DUF1192 family)
MSHGWTSGSDSDSDSDSDSNSDYSESDSYKGIGAGVRLKTVKEQKDEQNAKVAQLKQKLKVTIFGDEDDELADLREQISQLEELLEVIPENELQQQVDNLEDEIERLQGQLRQASNDDTSKAAEVSRLTGENTQLVNQIRESAATHQSGLEENQDKMTAACDVLLEERNKEYDARIAGLTSKIKGLEDKQTPDSSTLRDSLQAEIKRLKDENAKAVDDIKELRGEVSGYVKEAKAQLSVIETCAQQLETATRTSGDWEARAAQLQRAYGGLEALVVQANQQHESKVALLTQQLNTSENVTNSNLQTIIDGLQSEKQTFESSLKTATDNLTANDLRITELEAEISKCGEEKARLKQQIDAAKLQLATADTAQQKCEADKDELLRQIADMRAAVQPPVVVPLPVVVPPPQPVVVPQPPLVVPQPRPQPTEADRMAAELAEYLATNAMGASAIFNKSLKIMKGNVKITTDNLTDDDIQLLADAIDCMKLGDGEKRNVGLFIQSVHDELLENDGKGIAPGEYIFAIKKKEDTGKYTMSMTLNPPDGTPAGAQFPFKFDSAVSKENVSRFKKIGPLIKKLLEGNKLTTEGNKLTANEKVFVKEFADEIVFKGDIITRYGMLAERGLFAANNDGYLGGLFHGLKEITGDDIEMILNLIFTMHSCNGGKAVVEEGTGKLGQLFEVALKTWMGKYVQVPEEDDDDDEDQDPMRPFIEGVHQAVTTILTIDADGKLTTDMEEKVSAEIVKIKDLFGTLSDETLKAEAGLIFNRISAFLMTAAPKDGGTFITVNDVCKQFQTVRAFVVGHLDTTPAKGGDSGMDVDGGTNVQGLTFTSDTINAGAVGTTVSSLERMMGMLNAGK